MLVSVTLVISVYKSIFDNYIYLVPKMYFGYYGILVFPSTLRTPLLTKSCCVLKRYCLDLKYKDNRYSKLGSKIIK